MGKKDKNNIKYKRRGGTNVLLIMVITLTIYLCKPVYAVDISYPGPGDIICMWQHSNGNIRVMDGLGHVAEFDYVKWTKINDTEINAIIYGGYLEFPVITHNFIKGGENKIAKDGWLYDIEQNTWKCILNNITPSERYLCIYGSKLYTYTSINLDDNPRAAKYLRLIEHDLEGNFIRNIDFKNLLTSTYTNNFYANPYNSCEDTVTFYDDKTSAPYRTYVFLDMKSLYGDNSNSGRDTGKTNLIYQSSLNRGVGTKHSSESGGHYYICGYSVIEVDGFPGIGNSQVLGTIASAPIKVEEPKGSGIMVSKNIVLIESLRPNNRDYYYYINTDISPTVGCYDKFGNVVLGGGRRLVVISSSNRDYYDSNFYTDSQIGELKEYSLEAKNAAIKAESKASEAVDKVSAVQKDVTWIKNNLPHPQIWSISGKNSATATNSDDFNIQINANGNNLIYRVQCDSFDSGWTDISTITISGLGNKGVKTATVRVSNNPTDPDNGNISEGYFTFFRI